MEVGDVPYNVWKYVNLSSLGMLSVVPSKPHNYSSTLFRHQLLISLAVECIH